MALPAWCLLCFHILRAPSVTVVDLVFETYKLVFPGRKLQTGKNQTVSLC